MLKSKQKAYARQRLPYIRSYLLRKLTLLFIHYVDSASIAFSFRFAYDKAGLTFPLRGQRDHQFLASLRSRQTGSYLSTAWIIRPTNSRVATLATIWVSFTSSATFGERNTFCAQRAGCRVIGFNIQMQQSFSTYTKINLATAAVN